MDISKSNTESFINYLRFHERLNRTVKVATTGLGTLKRLVDVTNGDVLLGIMIDSNDEPWAKGKRYPKPEDLINDTLKSFSQMSSVESLSAFDWYTSGVISELCQFSEDTRNNKFPHAHADSDYKPTKPIDFKKCCVAYSIQYSNNHRLARRLEKIRDDLEINSKDYDNLIPLFHYFRLVRNCYAHYNGSVDKELEAYLSNKEFEKSCKFWDEKSSNKSPSLPTGKQGDVIEFSNLNGIMSSAVCFEIAKIINYKAVEILGEDGILKMAAFHSLLSTYHEFRRKNHKAAESAVAYFLTNRYLVKDVDKDSLPRKLKRLRIWNNCFDRYKMIYEQKLQPIKKRH